MSPEAKTQFSYTILSKRKLTWFVENGYAWSLGFRVYGLGIEVYQGFPWYSGDSFEGTLLYPTSGSLEGDLLERVPPNPNSQV